MEAVSDSVKRGKLRSGGHAEMMQTERRYCDDLGYTADGDTEIVKLFFRKNGRGTR